MTSNDRIRAAADWFNRNQGGRIQTIREDLDGSVTIKYSPLNGTTLFVYRVHAADIDRVLATPKPATYFVVYTVDTDDPADAIAIARSMDPPTDIPTIDELENRIVGSLSGLVDGIDAAEDIDAVLVAEARRIIEIVTLGNVPAGGES